MKTFNFLLMISRGIILGITLLACSACAKAQDSKNAALDMKSQLTQSVKDLSPAEEFQKNKADNKICFYSFGSLAFGYKIPGITDDDKKTFIDGKSTPVINRFSDDPEPVFSSDAYWEAVVSFLTQYNALVLKHLKEQPSKTP